MLIIYHLLSGIYLLFFFKYLLSFIVLVFDSDVLIQFLKLISISNSFNKTNPLYTDPRLIWQYRWFFVTVTMAVNSPEPTLYSVILSCVCYSTLFGEYVNDIIVFYEHKVNGRFWRTQSQKWRNNADCSCNTVAVAHSLTK